MAIWLSLLTFRILAVQNSHQKYYLERKPFYIWHIGESTSQQPFGLYIGTDRQLPNALKLALETLIKHLREER